MDIDHQNNKDDGVREQCNEIESELVRGGSPGRTDIRDTHSVVTTTTLPLLAGSPLYLPISNPNYGSRLPEQNSPAGRGEEVENNENKEHDSPSNSNSPPYDHTHLHNGINGDASGNGKRYAIGDGEELDLDNHRNIHLPKEVAGQEQRTRGLSIDDLLTGPGSLPRIHSNPYSTSALSTPTSISPATPEDYPTPYHHYIPGSIHSPVPLPLRPRSSFGSTARPISNRRPGPNNTPRSRASPYLTSAARHEGVGLGINMMNSPSTPGEMHSHSDSPLGMGMGMGAGPGNSPGSMSSRRRKAPEWPEPKSARSHSFNQSTASTPRDMYQTLKTPAALRVPSTAQLLSRPGEVHSPMLIPGSASGLGPIRRGMPASSAPPLSAARVDTQSPQIPSTPRRVHLLDVPRAKVISTLNERAGKYWFDPSTSDCRICEFSLFHPESFS